MDWRPWRERWLRFWRSENPRVRSVRDLAGALLVLGLLLGTLWLYAGQPFPKEAPLVVVESGSMMHGPRGGFPTPHFGRIGTIDPGDLVIVKRVRSPDQIETAFGSGGRDGYGGHGDVIVYKTGGTPIIHRAMLYIEARPDGCTPNGPINPCTFRLRETCDAERFAAFVRAGPASQWRQYCEGSSEPITLSLERDGLRLDLADYPCESTCDPFHSGFITKGDNNAIPDQPPQYSQRMRPGQNVCCPVPLSDVMGKARGELPWFGLIKLAIFGNARYPEGGDPTGANQWVILNARAPWDEWVALFLSIGVIVAAPPAIEFAIKRWRERRKDA